MLFALATAFSACFRSIEKQTMTVIDGPKTYSSTGTVVSTDLAERQIAIAHEDIPGLMKAMTMDFKVKDAVMLDGLKGGDKVAFDLEKDGKEMTVTKLAKIGETVSGAEVFKANCAECHGAKGEGAKKGIPLISGHALDHPEEEHLAQVRDGEGKKMPAFKEKLTDEEIKAVVRFVREELQKGAKPASGEVHKH
jgi:mono/diheme cytochrome c family protein